MGKERGGRTAVRVDKHEFVDNACQDSRGDVG
jgi:hypothetical protein